MPSLGYWGRYEILWSATLDKCTGCDVDFVEFRQLYSSFLAGCCVVLFSGVFALLVLSYISSAYARRHCGHPVARAQQGFELIKHGSKIIVNPEIALQHCSTSVSMPTNPSCPSGPAPPTSSATEMEQNQIRDSTNRAHEPVQVSFLHGILPFVPLLARIVRQTLSLRNHWGL
jgi:hypothetical protein